MYVIAEGVWHHRRCIFAILRIDYIHFLRKSAEYQNDFVIFVRKKPLRNSYKTILKTIHGKEAIVSTDDSSVKVVVIPTNEELVIARDTKELSK